MSLRGDRAQATLARGHTPGSVTAALVALPYTVGARAQLRRHGVLRPGRDALLSLGLGLAALATVGAHAGSRLFLRRGWRR